MSQEMVHLAEREEMIGYWGNLASWTMGRVNAGDPHLLCRLDEPRQTHAFVSAPHDARLAGLG